ncbi:hypothetical protein AAMO2058_001020700 [Amorphochlora amoebiformis]|uniref:Peptidyl-prolyl cis-trans isomerase n=1 Tax=Amorphochlora amoebiformis TaxID=1561963 RepID=A0A6T6VFS4_9EUKA|mmetsp:Transcript_25882/g.40986  ORF Transcript_25882/g.40986 Transcript_25882/m.40986 type:complete len:235 (+) Transcript_25882:77-781(+)
MSSGYTKSILVAGVGQKPKKGDSVTVHCTGMGKNRDLNQKFWSTKDPGQEPFTFTIGEGKVIPAWDEGVLTMQKGEKAVITAQPHYAYGARGFPAWGIMPNSVLKFEIELLSFGPSKIKASHILVKHEKSRRLASWKDENGVEIKKRSVADAHAILNGYLNEIKISQDKKATFAAIASKHSDCSSGPRNQGDLGWFGRGDMQKGFEKGAFALQVGEISEVVNSGSGSHIIMRTG